MNSFRVFLYEMKMIMSSKLFIFFLLVTIVFSYSLMRNLTVLGVANTAPFSQWSYSSFLCSINSLLMPLLLLLCGRIYDKKELRVRPLIFSTPISDAKYYLIKGIAVFNAYILAALAAILVSFIFYIVVFRFSGFTSLMFPVSLFMLPPAVFIFGLGMLLGKLDERLIYLLVPVMFLLPVLKFELPIWIDPFCGNIITQYPLKVMLISGNNTDNFILPSGLFVSRCLFLIIGLALYAMVCTKNVKKDIQRKSKNKIRICRKGIFYGKS